VKKWILYGERDKPETWAFLQNPKECWHVNPIASFQSEFEARSWVRKEIQAKLTQLKATENRLVEKTAVVPHDERGNNLPTRVNVPTPVGVVFG